MANAFRQQPFHGTRKIASVGAPFGNADYTSTGTIVTVTGGGGYNTADMINLTTITSGSSPTYQITGVTVTDGGMGFSSLPTLTVTDATGTGFAGVPTMSGGLAANTNGTIYTVPGSTTTVVIGCTISNQTTSAIAIDLLYYDATTASDIGENYFGYGKGIPIPANSSLEIMSGNKINMETGDKLYIRCNTDYAFEAMLSIMEIS